MRKSQEERPLSLEERVREGLGQGLQGQALVSLLEQEFPGNRDRIVHCVEQQTAALWKEFAQPIEAHHGQACAFYRGVKQNAEASLSQKLRAQQKLDDLEQVADRAVEMRETGRPDPVVIEAFAFYGWVQTSPTANVGQRLTARIRTDRLLGVSGPCRVWLPAGPARPDDPPVAARSERNAPAPAPGPATPSTAGVSHQRDLAAVGG